MSTDASPTELDLIGELRLRRWARVHYVSPAQRDEADWHPVVLDEMRRKDAEQLEPYAPLVVKTAAPPAVRVTRRRREGTSETAAVRC